jgi:hypothetical protein
LHPVTAADTLAGAMGASAPEDWVITVVDDGSLPASGA